jgi:hypothetical protein
MMSDKQSIMKFEFLPNEILLECFQYFNAFELFHSFDQLNNRFNQLIRHIPLCIDFQNINKSVFDEFCTKMLLNPTIKNQIYSLYLPNDDRCFQTNAFWSHFSFNEFPNLQTYISTISLLPNVINNKPWMEELPKAKVKTIDLIFSNLRTLSILTLDFTSRNTHQTSFITNLTLSKCSFNQFHQLSTYVPMLKYLHINEMRDKQFDTTLSSDKKGCCVYLNKLIVENFSGTFDEFELLVKRTPNLKYLLIYTSYVVDMIDADRWEQLIRSLLPHLTVFKFIFDKLYHFRISDIITKFQKFQTNFWQHEHHWFTELIQNQNLRNIYTIPYCKNEFTLSSDPNEHQNNLANRVHVYKNVTHLELYIESVTKNDEYYFPNITELELNSNYGVYLNKQCIEYLKKTVNLFNLQHLIIRAKTIVCDAFVLLMIFKEARQLSSLNICWNLLTSFLADQELCNYFNTMIKALYIRNNFYDKVGRDEPNFDAEKFCQIFSNIEHLQFQSIDEKQLFFVFNRLSKLKTLTAHWKTNNSDEDSIQFEKKLQKLNLIYHMNTVACAEESFLYPIESVNCTYKIDLRIWFGNNASK